jgi:hypothetical protein
VICKRLRCAQQINVRITILGSCEKVFLEERPFWAFADGKSLLENAPLDSRRFRVKQVSRGLAALVDVAGTHIRHAYSASVHLGGICPRRIPRRRMSHRRLPHRRAPYIWAYISRTGMHLIHGRACIL